MFHFSTPVPDWPRAVASLPASFVIKAIDNVQMLAESKATNLGVKTILRHWYTAQVPGDSVADNYQRARDFFDSFIDGTFINGSTHGWNHAAATDYVEEFTQGIPRAKVLSAQALMHEVSAGTDADKYAGTVQAASAIDSQLDQILNADRGAVFAVQNDQGETIGALNREVVVDLLANSQRKS